MMPKLALTVDIPNDKISDFTKAVSFASKGALAPDANPNEVRQYLNQQVLEDFRKIYRDYIKREIETGRGPDLGLKE